MLLDVAYRLPFERTKRETYKIALFQLTEEGGGARKTAPRYRSRAAFEDIDAKAQHEHVVTRQWLRHALEARPDLSETLALAVACLVTKDEHKRLSAAPPELFGWQRYLHASIEVLDAGNDFKPADLQALADQQLACRDKVQAALGRSRDGLMTNDARR